MRVQDGNRDLIKFNSVSTATGFIVAVSDTRTHEKEKWDGLLSCYRPKCSSYLEIIELDKKTCASECNQDDDKSFGCFKPDYKGGNCKIVINGDLPPDFKARILLHELGHAFCHFNGDGNIQQEMFGTCTREDGTTLHEIEGTNEMLAYRYQLSKLLDLYECWKEPLKNAIERLTTKVKSSETEPYCRRAIAKIMQTDLWERCVKTAEK